MGNGIRLKVTPLQGDLISEGMKKDANLPPSEDSRTSLTNNLTQLTIPTLVLDLECCYLAIIAIEFNLTELLHL